MPPPLDTVSVIGRQDMWLAITVALTFSSFDASRTLPFALNDGAIVVRVRLDGQGPFRFLLDTGASQSVVRETVARRLLLMARSRTVMVTPTGHRTTWPVTRLEKLELGGMEMTGVPVTVVADHVLSGHFDVDGIIGQQLLAPFTFTIDYQRKTITWHREPVSPAGVRLPLTRAGDRVFVMLPQGRDGVQLQMIPDTGSDTLVLFARAGRALPPMTPLDVVLLRTTSGQRLVRRVLLDNFRAGDLQLRDQVAALVPRADRDAPDGDGLLPLHIFSRVTFNGPEGYVAVEC
jgi:predicted aspartyl protease